MANKKSFYDILAVSKNATDEDIKKAYRKMAIKWHPDKNLEKPEESAEMFKAIAEAYDTLSDPAKRRNYDAGGDPASFERRASRDAGRSSHSSNHFQSSFDDRRAFDIFEHFFAQMNTDHDDFFNDSFFNRGGGARGSGGARENPMDAFFSRSGFGGFGSMMGGFDDDFGGMMGGSSVSRSTSFSSGSGRSGTSTSTSTVIGPDGRKVTKKTTTVYNPDGSSETKTEEFVEQLQPNSRLAYDSGERGLARKPSKDRSYF